MTKYPVPPMDPALVAMHDVILSSFVPSNAETLHELRAATAAMMAALAPDYTAGGAVIVEEATATAEDGYEIPLIILRPAGATGPLPVLYNTHGGGMIAGDNKTELAWFLDVVVDGLAGIVSVDYRLAPEHPDPTPIEDCYAGLVWTAEHAADYGFDPERIMVVGTSAGGGLAAGTALLARDRKGPKLTHQILGCPMLDDRMQTPSSRMLEGRAMWSADDNEFGWTCLLGDRRGGPDVSYYAAPARATDLSDLPPAFIDVGTVETFRDEVIDYALRLSQAGNRVEFHLWDGGFHGFDSVVPDAEISIAQRAAKNAYIRRALTS